MWVGALFVVGLCAGALLAFSFATERVFALGVWPYYAVIAVSGFARSFLQPARNALGAELVPRELYHNAIAWRSSTWQTAAVIGPAAGGLLYGFGGPRIAYIVQAVLMSIAFVTFARIEYAGPPRAAAPAAAR